MRKTSNNILFFVMCLIMLFANVAMATKNGDNKTKCTKPAPPKPPAPKPVHVITDLKSTSTSTSNASAAAASSSKSDSNATATGGNASATAQGGNVKDSGNSTNTLGQTQGQTQTADATNNGNGSNNTTISTNVAAAKIPVSTAYAPEVLPTAPCIKGLSGGAQTAPFGISLGGGKVDEGCDIRQEALTYLAAGSREGFCRLITTSKRSRKAGMTYEKCIAVPTPAPVPDAPSAALIPPISTLPVYPLVSVHDLAPAKPTPVALQTCQLTGNRVDNVCKAKLDDAGLYFRDQEGGYLVVTANALTGKVRANNAKAYLVTTGIAETSIRTALTTENNPGVTVEFIQD